MTPERRRHLDNVVTTIAVLGAVFRPPAPALAEELHQRLCRLAAGRHATTPNAVCLAVELTQERLRDTSRDLESQIAQHLEEQQRRDREQALTPPNGVASTPRRRRIRQLER